MGRRLVQQVNGFDRATELFALPVSSPTRYDDAVVHDAAQDAGCAVDAEIGFELHLSVGPVECVRGTRLDAELALHTPTRRDVDHHASLYKKGFNDPDRA
jgi:hypothetical protein